MKWLKKHIDQCYRNDAITAVMVDRAANSAAAALNLAA
jgi:hypothetical protein